MHLFRLLVLALGSAHSPGCSCSSVWVDATPERLRHLLALRVCLTRCPRTRWSSTGPLQRLRELEIVRRILDSVGSSPAHRGIRPDLNITTVSHFLHWPIALSAGPGPHPERRQSSFSPMRTNGPFLLGASDDLSMPVAILSLLLRTATPFLSGARAQCEAFSPLAWSQRNLRLAPSLP
jgi:hypothetical protein